MKIGFAFCGSFCNHPELLKLYADIAREHEIVPILSENAAKYSTRFGTAEDFVTRVEAPDDLREHLDEFADIFNQYSELS